MRLRAALLWFVVAAVVASLGVILLPRLRGPQPPAAPAYWPTQGWQRATPEEMGFDSGKVASMLLAIRDKGIKVHSLLVIRRGYAFVDAT